MASADPQPQPDNVSRVSHNSEAVSFSHTDDFDANDDQDDPRSTESGHNLTASMRDKKIGHRRVDKSGNVSYKKKPTSELMAAIQLGIGQSVGGLSSKPERDVLMQDFGVVEVVFFPGEGSNLTPAHHYSDFRFKTYAPVAFRYFRDLFGIQPDDFMLSLCDEPLKVLSNPGASGSIFYLTQDDEFIIKTVQHKEADFLQKLLPGYFLNISQNKRTLLPKFYGLYCYQCGGKNIRFIIMNNLLPSTVKLHEKYDMKGSTYKRKASKNERQKSSPTLKDLDFMENHLEGIHLEKDTYDALIKTLQRDCRVLESFKIMDYSLLVGIYNLDIVNKEKAEKSKTSLNQENISPSDSMSPKPDGQNTALQRGKSFKARIGQYSTPLESIQGNTELPDDIEEEDVPPGGIPARNSKGERLLLYLGIIDILQSFRLKKRLEHTVKSMVIDGDTISVHRPSYYAQRFLTYHASRVFKKVPTALKHSPSKKRSMMYKSKAQAVAGEQTEPVRSGRTISFSDDTTLPVSTGAVGGKPDLLPPDYSSTKESAVRLPSPKSPHSDKGANVNGSRHSRRSDAMTSYLSEDAISAGTASTASLRGVGGPYTTRGASPPLSLSESTPTHTDFTEGTPSFTNSSPSCSSDVMDMGSANPLQAETGVNSPARSPDLRHGLRSRTQPSKAADVRVQVIPESPPASSLSVTTAGLDQTKKMTSQEDSTSSSTSSPSNTTMVSAQEVLTPALETEMTKL